MDYIVDATGAADASVITSIQIHIPTLIIGFLCFGSVRKKFISIYNPKTFDDEKRHRYVDEDESVGWLGWISVALSASDDDLLEFAGLNGLIFIRFQHLALKIVLSCLACSVFLIPVYASGDHLRDTLNNNNNNNKVETHTNFVTQWSTGNLGFQDNLLWFPTFAMCMISIYSMYLLQKEYMYFIKKRQDYLIQLAPAQYTVVLDDLPQHLSSEKAIHHYLRGMFPNDVECIYITKNLDKIETLLDERDQIAAKTQQTMDQYLLPEKDWLCCASKSSLIEKKLMKLEKVNHQIAQLLKEEFQKHENHENHETHETQGKHGKHGKQEAYLTDMTITNLDNEMMGKDSSFSSSSSSTSLSFFDQHQQQETRIKSLIFQNEESKLSDVVSSLSFEKQPSVFLSFRSLTTVMTAQQVLQCSVPNHVRVQFAPHPEDIEWDNLGIPLTKREMGGLFATLAIIGMTLFWSIPVSLVTSLSNLDRLQEYFPILRKLLLSVPQLGITLKQVTPVLVNFLLSLVPELLRIFLNLNAPISSSSLEVSVFQKFTIFQIIQVFLVVSLTATASGSFSEIYKNPSNTPIILGRNLPTQTTFFITMTLIQMVVYLFELFRITDIFGSMVYHLFAPQRTAKERESSWWGFDSISRSGEIEISTNLSDSCLYLVLILSYAVISPLMAIFGVLHFAISILVYRRQILYVYDYCNSGGVFAHQSYSIVIWGILLGQCTLLGVVSLHGGMHQAVAIVVCILGTLLFNRYFQKVYPKQAEVLAMDKCREIDQLRTNQDFAFLQGVYKQEALEADINEYAYLFSQNSTRMSSSASVSTPSIFSNVTTNEKTPLLL